jgi:anti-sigma regulatory factor (Ser/Thr protein kinase)
MPGSFPRTATDLPAGYARRAGSPALGAPHRLVIDGVPEQVSAARAFVRRVLGSGHPGADRVALLTSELVTNSVEHSGSRRDGGTITITLRAGADRILVEVADDGGAAGPALSRDGALAETGRGLRLVDALSLAWDYHRGATGTVTWFECPPAPLP